jgi:hypothetical protein
MLVISKYENQNGTTGLDHKPLIFINVQLHQGGTLDVKQSGVKKERKTMTGHLTRILDQKIEKDIKKS